MTNLDLVNKVIGKINPIGNSDIDEQRFENLKEMRSLTEALMSQIIDVYVHNMNSKQGSVIRSVEYAKDFLYNYLDLDKTKL